MQDLQYLIELIVINCRNVAQIQSDLEFWNRSAERDMRLFLEKMTMLKGYSPDMYDSLCAIISPVAEVTYDVEFQLVGTRLGTDFWDA